jgi:hypothetical protein
MNWAVAGWTSVNQLPLFPASPFVPDFVALGRPCVGVALSSTQSSKAKQTGYNTLGMSRASQRCDGVSVLSQNSPQPSARRTPVLNNEKMFRVCMSSIECARVQRRKPKER